MQVRSSNKCLLTLDHSVANLISSSQIKEEKAPIKENLVSDVDSPQIYSLQFIEKWPGLGDNTRDLSLLMTSANDRIYMWDLVIEEEPIDNVCIIIDKNHDLPPSTKLTIKMIRVFSLYFTDISKGYGGVFLEYAAGDGTIRNASSRSSLEHGNSGTSSLNVFGGERNPDQLVFVFDASYCHGNHLLAAALSDGTCRLVNPRGVCVSILQLPDCNTHLTALAWDSKGTRIATCVASGHLIFWGINCGDGKGAIIPSCISVLDGGHDNRPLFGAAYCGGENDVSYSSF